MPIEQEHALYSLLKKKNPHERKFRHELKLGFMYVLKINEKSEKTTLKRLIFCLRSVICYLNQFTQIIEF